MTLAPTIDATGINAPSYATVMAGLVSAYQAIYGSDVVLTPATQDGQFLAIIAAAINDSNAVAVNVYNGFSPATAQGAALSSSVKLNGLARNIATPSTVPLTIVGVANTVITNGQVRDTSKNLWALPTTVTIPSGGSIVVTGTTLVAGATPAAIGTVTQIATPTLGWQTVTNATAATLGAPVESDASLRRRQALSTALSSQTPVDAINAAVLAVANVSKVATYENPTGTADANGIPAHSFAVVAAGGTDTAVATAIMSKKGQGSGTYGTTTVAVTDSRGSVNNISFFRPTSASITVTVNLTGFPGYQSTTSDAIKASVIAYINSLTIGDDIYLSRIYPPAQLPGDPRAATYHITSILIARDGGTPTASDIVIGFNELAIAATGAVTVNVS